MTEVRSRTRAIQVGDAEDVIAKNLAESKMAKIKEAAELFKAANARKNEAGTDERKAQKELDKLMAAASEGKEWSFIMEFDGAPHDVHYAQGTGEELSVKKLMDLFTKKRFTKEQFLKVIKTTRGAIEKEIGSNIANAIAATVAGKWKVSIKVRK